MIGYIEGKLSVKTPALIVIDVGGVGYEMHISLTTYNQIGKIGEKLKIFTYLYVREDKLDLYGFATEDEKGFFKTLISISGIGPSVAIRILSAIKADRFKAAVVDEDVGILTTIPGIGKKTAQRIIVELKDKIGILTEKESAYLAGKSPEERSVIDDSISALVSLGYSCAIAQRAVDKVLAETKEEIKIEELIRKSLKFVN
ncbi:Holliday junction branch migration protein RuvA [bacterium]|nr:Holliday junction branch migration protein RuvA [bacterium]